MPSYAEMNIQQLRLCAKEGDTEAQFLLGVRLLSVRGEALAGTDFLKEAAKKRHLQANERLGSVYLYGEGGVPQDKKQAMVYYEQALGLGSMTARTRLTELYLESPDKAKRGLRLLTDMADAGDPAAATRAARLYLTGEVEGVDFEKAARYAILSDDTTVLYEAAEKLDVLGAEEKLRDELYQKLAQKDRKGAQLGIAACITLGRMYRLGKGIAQDGRSAERLLRRAMELETQQAMVQPKAALELAQLYETGAAGLPADHAAARRLLMGLYKDGSEVARLRYVKLCTADKLYLNAYRAYAESRQFRQALSYILTNWEDIPDKAGFVDRAILFAEPVHKADAAMRALRDELYIRQLATGRAADQVLTYALQKKDIQGALTFFEGLSDADKSVVYANRELCASVPQPHPGEAAELAQLRKALGEVPESIQVWEDTLLRFRGCMGAQAKWDFAQSTLPTLPEPAASEPVQLTRLREQLSGVSQPPPPPPVVVVPTPTVQPEAPEPEETENPYMRQLAHYQRLSRISDARRDYALQELPQLPQPSPHEDAMLTELRATLNNCLNNYWRVYLSSLETAGDEQRRKELARKVSAQCIPVAQALYSGRPNADFDRLCGAIEQILSKKTQTIEEENAVDVDGLLAQRSALKRQPSKALLFAVDTLLALPPQQNGEDKALTALRGTLQSDLRRRWTELTGVFSKKSPDNADDVRQARMVSEQFLRPAHTLYDHVPCEPFDALCAQIVRILEGPQEKRHTVTRHSSQWADALAHLRTMDPIVPRLPELAASHYSLPAQKAGEDAMLTQYRAELRDTLLAAIKELDAGLDAMQTADEKQRFAARCNRFVQFTLPAGVVAGSELTALRARFAKASQVPVSPWEVRLNAIENASSRQARDKLIDAAARKLPPPADDEPQALIDLRQLCIAQEWQVRLNSFNKLTNEGKKRDFANGSMGKLPEKTKGEDASLSILRSLITPYQVGNDVKPVAVHHIEDATQQKPAPDPGWQQVEMPESSKAPKKRGGIWKVLVSALVLLVVVAGAIILWPRGGGPGTPPGKAPAPSSVVPPSGAATLTELEPIVIPSRFYIDRWTNNAHNEDLYILDGDAERKTRGIGWFVPSSSIGSKAAGSQGEAELVYSLQGRYNRLSFGASADARWNDGAQGGTFNLAVYCDGELAYESGWCDYTASLMDIVVELNGCDELKIVLTEQRGELGTLNIVMGDLVLE